MVVSVGRTAALNYCGLRSPTVAILASMACRLAPHQRTVFSALISAGLKPFSTLWLTNNSPPSSVSRRVFAPGVLFHLRRTYYGDGGPGVPRSSPGRDGGERGNDNASAQVVGYERNGHERQPERPPLIQWEKDLANAVQLIGNVGRDVEIKYLDTGNVVATTSLAVNKGGSKRNEEPSWFQLELWDALAEIAAYHVKKGERIFVTGRIEVKQWIKNEVKYNIATVVVRDLCYVESTYSDQSPAYGQSNVSQQGEVTNMDYSQRNWNQQQLASQPPQSTAPQSFQKASSASYEDAALATEKKWQEYFSDPTQWWDNRVNKRNPKAPDFKHKSTQEALWINSWNNPPWVAQQLAVLEEKKAQHSEDFGDSRNRQNYKKLSTFRDSDFLH